MALDTQKSLKGFDQAIAKIAKYAADEHEFSPLALDTAFCCLADSLGCAMLALNFNECTKILGPIVKGSTCDKGSRVPGTDYILDPVQAAFNIGTCIRWLDYNDTWLAAEWGHPSDNLGALLSIADWLDQNERQVTVKELLHAMIKAHEIQGVLALENSFNKIGFDHVILVKVASVAISAKMLGADEEVIANAISHAWIDTGPLRTYRHAPNTGSRKSWAAGDATARGLFLALIANRGEMGYKTALSAKEWGFYDLLFSGKPFTLPQDFGSYVMENILFKISYPAEFHAQTAVEAACTLYPQVKDRWEEIDEIKIETHESAIRIIDKKGQLFNPADRDHCLQYMVAIGLLKGNLTADDYEDHTANDPRVDTLRDKMVVTEDPAFTKDYSDPEKRSIANCLTISFKDGTVIGPVRVEYPLGHKKRRQEGIPLIYEKLKKNLSTHFSKEKTEQIINLFKDRKAAEKMRVRDLMNYLC